MRELWNRKIGLKDISNLQLIAELSAALIITAIIIAGAVIGTYLVWDEAKPNGDPTWGRLAVVIISVFSALSIYIVWMLAYIVISLKNSNAWFRKRRKK